MHRFSLVARLLADVDADCGAGAGGGSGCGDYGAGDAASGCCLRGTAVGCAIISVHGLASWAACCAPGPEPRDTASVARWGRLRPSLSM